MFLSRRTLLLSGAGLTLVGCGGGGGTLPDPHLISRVRPRLAIHWAPRSRAVSGPQSASVAVITARSLVIAGQVATAEVSRYSLSQSSGSQGATATYELTPELPVGPVELSVRFYDSLSGYPGDSSRVLVAVAQQQVELQGPGGLLPDIAVAGLVASVSLLPDQVVPLAGRTDLKFTALDSAGNTLALGPSAASLEIVEGKDTVLASDLTLGVGYFRGLAEGTAQVRVRIDDKVSPPIPVRVTRFPAVSPGLWMGSGIADMVWDAGRQKLWIVDVSGGTNTLQTLDPATRALGTPIIVPGGGLSNLKLAPDGRSLYGYVKGTNTIQRIALETGVVEARIELPQRIYPEERGIFWMLPGPARSLLVAWHSGDSQQRDIWVYDGSVRRPVSLRRVLGTLETELVLTEVSSNDEGTVAYISGGGVGWRVGIGPDGFMAGTVSRAPSGTFHQGQLIDSSARVCEATTGTLLSSLGASFEGNRSLGVAANGSYWVLEGLSSSRQRLRLVEPQHFTEQGRLELPEYLPVFQNFTTTTYTYYYDTQKAASWGARGVALLVSEQLSLYDNLPGL
ncbi:YncE family protein [Armatimonas sp.]|uniref:YncE family protein n=1 Tax=Armatimonas sp. TaxID=1872638 RepID=UPI0037516256